MNKTLRILSLATLVISASAQAVSTVKVGIFLPMSGGQASFGKEVYSGVKMAVDEINAKGEVKIVHVLEDEKSETTDSANAVKKLINVDKVNVIMGSVASSNTNAAAPIAQAAQVPLLTPASTNVNVTQKGDYIARICFIDDFQGPAMAKFALNSLRAKTAAIVTDSASDYSRGLSTTFKAAFEKGGGKVVTEVSYVAKDQDFSSQLTKVRTQKPDVVFVPGYYTEAANMIRQAKKLGVKAKFIGGDGWSGEQLYTIAGDAIEGNYHAAHFAADDSDVQVQAFVKKYKAVNGGRLPNDMAALGYDAMYVIAESVKRNGGKVDGPSLKNAINATKNFAGVTGMITLDTNRNATKPLVILETKKNVAVFKERVAP